MKIHTPRSVEHILSIPRVRCTISKGRIVALLLGLILCELMLISSACAQAVTTFVSGNFATNAVLSLAGSPAQEVYGVSFGASDNCITGNGYAFGHDSPYGVDADINLAYDVTGRSSGMLDGGGTSGDTTFDAMLGSARVGAGSGKLTLNNLMLGGRYKVLFILADTRNGTGGRTFSISSGNGTSATQIYAYTAGTSALGGYVLGTFTATSTTQTFTINNGCGYQLNAVLVCNLGSTASFGSGTFKNNSVLSLAGSSSQEVYGVNFGDGTARITANGYTFDNDASSNITYDVSGTYPTFLSGGGTSGDAAFDAVLTAGRVGSGTGRLTLNNLLPGGVYKVLFMLVDTRNGTGGRAFSITSGANTCPDQIYAFTSGTSALGGYVLATFTAAGTSQTFTLNNAYGYQLNAVLVCCAGSAISYSNGTFTNNSVLSLAGAPMQEIYGVSFGDSSARTTANGYRFDNDASSNVTYNAPNYYSSFLSGGGTSGDASFDAMLTTGGWGNGSGSLTLNKLVIGNTYKVLFLLADTRNGAGGLTFSAASNSGYASANQVYAYPGGTPALGGYILATFTATGTTQAFTVNNITGCQLNSVLVCNTDAWEACYTSGTFIDNSVLSLAGFPLQEIYGVNFGDGSARTTANGYTFDNDASSNVTYDVSGTYPTFLSGGGTSGDAAFDAVLTAGRVGGGTGRLTLKNLSDGVIYRVLFLLSDTRNGMGWRAFSITSDDGYTSLTQPYAFSAGTPALGGYVLATFTATGTTQTFTINNAYGCQLNAVLLCCVGANTPFKTIEAETGTLANGATLHVLGSSLPAVHTPELEASGRAFVKLAAPNASVTLKNNTSVTANGIVIRASIPDSSSGGGITATLDMYVDGVFRQALTLSSACTWTYAGGWSDNIPGPGKLPQKFFDDARAIITGAPIAPGSTVTLKKGSTNTAAYYDIDLIDLENIGPAKTQPANTLSVIDYGAIANGTNDNYTAFQNCFSAAQAQGKGVWIPEGFFYTNGILYANRITISGAGMWYTTLYRKMPIPNTNGLHSLLYFTDSSIRDVYIDSNYNGRDLVNGDDYTIYTCGTNGWFIDRVWSHNTQAFWLSGINGTIQNCRAFGHWGDGINFNNGSTIDTTGHNMTAQNNYIRGSCDDGLAINAQNGLGASGNMVNTRIIGNTSVAVTGADGLRIAGGRNSIVQNNLITDSAELDGMIIGTYGPLGNPLESAQVSGNYILRGGSIKNWDAAGVHITDGAPTLSGNMIIDSLTHGIVVEVVNATLNSNIVDGAALQGLWIPSNVTGTGIFQSNVIFNILPGHSVFQNDSPATFSTTLINNNWQ